MRYAIALVAVVLGACSVDAASNPHPRCTKDTDCGDAGGAYCYHGFCLVHPPMPACVSGTMRDCYDTGALGCTAGADGHFTCIPSCSNGQQLCVDGAWTACLGEHLPHPEVCNGGDDNCDGTPDEGLDGVVCDTMAPGACAAGTSRCNGGHLSCVPDHLPMPETCNAVDDDCDLETDEGTDEPCYPAATPGCVLAGGVYTCAGVCAPGAKLCVAGVLGSCTGSVIPAAADGCTTSGTPVDDDCDGTTDEDCICTPGTMQNCYSGPADTLGVGECHAGTQLCGSGMSFGACTGVRVPTAETCSNDGADDDCDGVMDNVPTRGDACTVPSAHGVCANGMLTCGATDLSCVGPTSMPETCNGLDDDCNDVIDNGFNLNTDVNNCGACGHMCGAGLTCCGGACVDTVSAASDCGTCGHSCGGGTCCNSACVDTGSDTNNCGSCGSSCAPGRSCCGGTCSDTQTDLNHCGSCTAAACSQACCRGVCQSPTAPDCTGCTADCGSMTCCIPSCANLMTDTAHCGSCANACGPGQLCCGGMCADTGPAHCGTCGNVCTTGQLCCGGGCVANNSAHCNSCTLSCGGARSTCCPTGCQDTQTDEMNCGGCGASHACGAGQTCCAGGCTNLNNDTHNCGMCGRGCLLGCTAGHCNLV